ncbi:SH3 domain-containing protein [Amphiplicatus metriothermophilus]|uniref:SH3 domain-containing protein n=1 Tax=Amphiplicatus metriothermophilus TaxID=1519374 RepID=A0A239PZ16_9PROT|nr:SH3 domain-containing protein [Amphiplicatus metriothermophilus]MBB5518269.1 surface antigen [Amphiplicatus metriothermophilus]SNT75504.1 SH3 domain-containing protein [Amphiplicatus metriothermophilus]
MKNPAKLTLLRIAAAFGMMSAAACETGSIYGSGGGGVNFAVGSTLAASLSGRDVEALYPAFVSAMEAGRAGAPVAWRGPNASGEVTPGRYLVGNLRSDPQATLPLGAPISLADPMEIELGLHALTANSNVRAGPSLEARVLEQLPAGTGVDAVGKVAGKPWMLVALDGQIRGYIHESLMIKAPGAELMLAGGPMRRPHPCRAFEQTLSVGGRTDRWSGVACERGAGWRVEPAPENAPTRLF